MIIIVEPLWKGSRMFCDCVKFYHTECINTIEMARSAASNGTSMVNNPIYETDGAIYEEIPGPRLTRTQAQLLEKEEGYVSISPSASADRNDPTASVKDTHTVSHIIEHWCPGEPVGGGGLSSKESPFGHSQRVKGKEPILDLFLL